MKKKLATLVTMWGVDLFFLSLIAIIFMIVFPVLENIKIFQTLILIFVFIGAISLWFAYIYSIVHVCKNNEFTQNKKIINLLLVLILSVFYTPIYYTRYVIKDKKWLGILKTVLYVLTFSVAIIGSLISIFNDLNTTQTAKYITSDNIVSIELTDNFNCETEDIGGYKLYCSSKFKNQSVGVFNYDFSFDTPYILEFHMNQLLKNYKAEGYIVQNEQRKGSLQKAEIVKNSSIYYVVVEVKEFDKTLKSVLIYCGNNKDVYQKYFASVNLIQNK